MNTVSATPISGSSPYAWLVGLVDAEPWMQDGLCGQTDPDLYFPERGGDWRQVSRAKAVCAQCDVRQQCLEYALRNNEKFGVWGGLDQRARKALRKKRDKTGRAA